MVSLAVSSEHIVLTFSSKVVVFKRLGGRLEDARTLLVGEPEAVSAVSDGATPSVCSALSGQGTFFVAASGKKLTLWETNNWNVVMSRSLVRAPSCVTFSASQDKILLSDKSGDAYVFDKDDQSPVNALLGHVSMLLRIASSPDDRFVITCDRDEKIRISHLPNAYNIQTYCMGHNDAVTCFNIPPSKPGVLVSGSSDGTIRLWKYINGKQIFCHDFDDLIVDLTTLPVDDDSFLICVIFKKRNLISTLLVHFSGDSLECRRLADLPIAITPLSLLSCGRELFVLSVDSPDFVTAYRNEGQSLLPCESINEELRNSLRKFNNDFASVTENILDDRLYTYLNKRRIDDTQEYYKRKQERLVGANSK